MVTTADQICNIECNVRRFSAGKVLQCCCLPSVVTPSPRLRPSSALRSSARLSSQLSLALRLDPHRSRSVPSVTISRVEYSDSNQAAYLLKRLLSTSGQGQFGRQQRGGLACVAMSYYRYITGVYKSYWPQVTST